MPNSASWHSVQLQKKRMEALDIHDSLLFLCIHSLPSFAHHSLLPFCLVTPLHLWRSSSGVHGVLINLYQFYLSSTVLQVGLSPRNLNSDDTCMEENTVARCALRTFRPRHLVGHDQLLLLEILQLHNVVSQEMSFC